MSGFQEKYGVSSAFEAAIGAFSSMILVYTLGSNVVLTPTVGLLLVLVWLSVWYLGISRFTFNFRILQHVLGDYLVALTVSVALGLFFKVITFSELFSWQFFGSTPVIISLSGVITAIVFDYTDSSSVIKRYLHSGYGDNGRAEKVANFCREKFKNSGEIEDCIKRLD